MDYLDPLYRKRHIIRLYTGYVLVAIALTLAVAMLLLVAKGYDISKDGQVIQKGFLFASSRPAGAAVYVDGIAVDQRTNTRLNIAEDSYHLELKRDGYRSWQHRVRVLGNSVVRYDYPVLFPEVLNTSVIRNFPTAPGVTTATPDNRWLLVQPVPSAASFDVYDLKNPKLKPVSIALPKTVYSTSGTQSWRVVEWASDNAHLLLRHGYGSKGAVEFVLLDRDKPAQSINLNTLFGVAADEIRLRDGKFDKFYLYFAQQRLLQTASSSAPVPQTYLSDVFEYEPYRADTMLYVSPKANNAAKVMVRLRQGDKIYDLRELPKGKAYHLAIDSYARKLHIAIADPDKKLVAIYKDPVAQVGSATLGVLPLAALPITSPDFLSFSVGGRFIVAERGSQFAAYDNEYKQKTAYNMTQPVDSGQQHANWMDGAHLQYVTNKQLYVFDYDGTNGQLLMPALANTKVFYDDGHKNAYMLAQTGTGKAVRYSLTTTPLLTPADL